MSVEKKESVRVAVLSGFADKAGHALAESLKSMLETRFDLMVQYAAPPEDALPLEPALLLRYEPDEAALKLFVHPQNQDAGPGDVFRTPFRLGALIDRAAWHIRHFERSSDLPAEIPIGPDIKLLTRNAALLNAASGKKIRLTEKERDILITLYQAGQAGMDRKTLLREVWGYAEDAETHTIETHIYRLRQKTEPDPAKPEIICTAGNGYVLGCFTERG
jgi:hypothetical protein